MTRKINLLKSLPKTKRSKKLLEERKKVKASGDDVISRLYGYDYFDGSRAYGYNGYHYDGRWIQVAKDIIEHYNLHQGAKILDIGAAKGFLVYDFCNQGMDAFGVDISRYACQHCPTSIVGRLHCGDIIDLQHFPSNTFDLVVSLATIHNVEQSVLYLAFKEINRIAKKNIFITVDAFRDEKEMEEFESWNLTAKSYGLPSWWLEKFAEYNYVGDYNWIIHEFGNE
jgi:cyclopropane fatty-acyl-phospholipid synthase-like methyltransferase